RLAEERILARLPREADAIEADLLRPRFRHFRPQRRGEKLAAEADAQHRPAVFDAPAQEPDLVAQVRPPILFVPAPSATQHGTRLAILRHRIRGEGADDAGSAQVGQEAPGPLARLVLADDHGGGEYIAAFSPVTRGRSCA